MWWDSDEDWRRGWGSLYSRWADEPSAAAAASVDWSAVPPSADPARSVRRGGAARGRRKRAQVESFLAILYASAALRSSLRDGDGDADGDADASSRGDGVGITVVDFGCGTGNLLLPLAALHPSVTFVGVDVNPRSIALLLERAKAARLRNVSAETGLIESYRGPAFDVALALHVCGEGTDAAMMQAQARNAAFVVAPCCVGKLKDGGLRSIEALKRDASANVSDAFEDEDGAAARFSVIHPRSAWMRGVRGDEPRAVPGRHGGFHRRVRGVGREVRRRDASDARQRLGRRRGGGRESRQRRRRLSEREHRRPRREEGY